MRLAVVGAGQMGSIYAAAAQQNGHDVRLIDANAEVIAAINERGLQIERRDGRSDTFWIPAQPEAESEADVVLFMVKGWATAQAGERVKAAVSDSTALLTLQNGLGNEEVLRSSFPKSDVLIGVSVHTVITIGPGHYSHTGVRDTYLGPTAHTDSTRAANVASVFRRDDAPVHVLSEAEVRREQWGKFVLNCASLPTMGLTRLPTRAALEVPLVMDHMDNITRETCEIAEAEGIQLDADERVAFQHELFRTAGGRASMLGDVLGRRRTEVDTINGAAITYASKHGLPAPLNRAMFALIKGLEHSFELGE